MYEINNNDKEKYKQEDSEMSGQAIDFNKISAGVYETLCPQHMLAPKDNLETMLLYYIKCQSWKREIIQPNIHRILPKVNQVIYTLDTICLPNTCIMILDQTVLQIFCSQSPLWVKCISLKRA